MISASQKNISDAFTEWERRFREDPKQFWTESEKLAQTPETYGELAAPYFIKILEELKAK